MCWLQGVIQILIKIQALPGLKKNNFTVPETNSLVKKIKLKVYKNMFIYLEKNKKRCQGENTMHLLKKFYSCTDKIISSFKANYVKLPKTGQKQMLPKIVIFINNNIKNKEQQYQNKIPINHTIYKMNYKY